MPLSRQERIRPLLDQFSAGNGGVTDRLVLNLYPSELDRFKGEFANLDFVVTNTKKTASSKIYEVCITIKTVQ